MNGDWLLRGRDGRLSVYRLPGDAVLCRAEREPGGPCADGYAHLVSWRPTGKGESGLVHSTHFRPRLAALDWSPLGHPLKKGDDRPGTLHALATSPDSTTLHYTDTSGGLCAWRPGGKPVTLLPSAGSGPVAAATLSPSTDRLLLTRRKDEPGLALEAWRQV